MKTYPLYFRDLKPGVQEELAKEHGYASPAEYQAETNGDVMPISEFVMFDRGEEPEED